MKVAATSSAEAEVIAAVESVKTASHFRSLLVELGMTDSEFIDVHEDTRACKMSAESLKCHKRARHYQSKLRYLQDCHQNGSIKFHQTPTDDMIADIFTKALPGPAHKRHMDTLVSDLPQAIVEMTLSPDSQENFRKIVKWERKIVSQPSKARLVPKIHVVVIRSAFCSMHVWHELVWVENSMI